MKKPTARTWRAIPLWVWAILALLVIGAGVFLLQGSLLAREGMPAEVSVTEAAAKRDHGAFILDVRQPEEWQEAHIPGAKLIPLGDLPNRLNEVPQDQEIVIVCRSGNRSATGRDILLNAGFTNVTSMAGGVTQWRAQGFEIATGQ